MTPNKKTNWKEMNEAAKAYGLVGKNGNYETKSGIPIDLSATKPDKLAVGYKVGKTLEKFISRNQLIENMKINKVFLNGVEITIEKAQQYVQDYMTLECFMGGIEIHTPDGILVAEVELA